MLTRNAVFHCRLIRHVMMPQNSSATGSCFLRFHRHLSTKDVFLKPLSDDIAKLIPEPPMPVGANISLSELAKGGQSVLEQLDLWSPWKPSSWLRWGYEYIHFTFDLPWSTTIIVGTIVLRLLLVIVPIKMQKLTAKQAQFTPEMDKFRKRTQQAVREGETALKMQVMMEQRDFLKAKGISPFGAMPILLANAGVFMTQFFAIKNMAKAKYPGFENEGLLWFQNLTVADPYWILPVVSAITLNLSFRLGFEVGNTDVMQTGMRLFYLYGLPVVIIFSSQWFPAAVTLYWVSSNGMTLLFGLLFQTKTFKRAFDIPDKPKTASSGTGMKQDFMDEWSRIKGQIAAPQSTAYLKKRDLENFRKAGRGRPLLLTDEAQDNKEQQKVSQAKG